MDEHKGIELSMVDVTSDLTHKMICEAIQSHCEKHGIDMRKMLVNMSAMRAKVQVTFLYFKGEKDG